MNVYDFDKTIYDGNCTFDFFIMLLKKDIRLIKFPIKYFFALILYSNHKITREKAEEQFYDFLRYIKNIDLEIYNFIPIAKRKIKTFYLERQKDDDLIISASPFFLVNAICRDIGIYNIIGTKINKNTGKYINDNVYCFGEAKVKYFQKYFQGEIIEQFYSDSKYDEPLAKLSKEAYIVHKHKIKKWF